MLSIMAFNLPSKGAQLMEDEHEDVTENFGSQLPWTIDFSWDFGGKFKIDNHESDTNIVAICNSTCKNMTLCGEEIFRTSYDAYFLMWLFFLVNTHPHTYLGKVSTWEKKIHDAYSNVDLWPLSSPYLSNTLH